MNHNGTCNKQAGIGDKAAYTAGKSNKGMFILLA
jgi:hypothetical protein